MVDITGGKSKKKTGHKKAGHKKAGHKKAGHKKAHAKKIPAIGTRAQVMHGNAKHTSGGLKKSDLKIKNGRIVSKKASKAATDRFHKKTKKQLQTS